MNQSTPTVVILAVAVALTAGVHYYLWARLVRDVGLSPSSKRAWAWILCGLGASIPVALGTSRVVAPERAVWWVLPAFSWLGASFLLFLSVALLDVLRTGYSWSFFGRQGPDPSRRQTLSRLGGLSAAAIGLGTSAWAVREAGKVLVKRWEVPLKKLPRELDGLSIVQLSDVHVGPTIGRDFIERVVVTVNDLTPDVVAITGDLVDGSVEHLAHHLAPLADLKAAHGTYFVTGNHEYYAGASAWCDHLGTLGIRVLRNEQVKLERDGHGFHLAGIDDHDAADFGDGHGADLQKAVRGRDPSCALVLLAHQPKSVYEAARHGVDLQLSGHTHGGQLWPFGWLVRLSQPLLAGFARFGETLLYVSSGTGYSGPPMRLDAPAEITHFILRSA